MIGSARSLALGMATQAHRHTFPTIPARRSSTHQIVLKFAVGLS